jgi:hypothetical protein
MEMITLGQLLAEEVCSHRESTFHHMHQVDWAVYIQSG